MSSPLARSVRRPSWFHSGYRLASAECVAHARGMKRLIALVVLAGCSGDRAQPAQPPVESPGGQVDAAASTPPPTAPGALPPATIVSAPMDGGLVVMARPLVTNLAV